MRPTTSTRRPKSADGWRPDASICSRSTTIWISTVATLAIGRRSEAAWSSAPDQSNEAFDRLVASVVSRGPDVPAVDRASGTSVARDAGVRMLSHDDASSAMRRAFRAQGVGIAEFPVNEETAREAAAAGESIVFGAPNVVRGGSHTGWTSGRHDRQGALFGACLRLLLSGAYCWPHSVSPPTACCRSPMPGNLISAGPATARRPHRSRRDLAQGRRADVLLVDDGVPLRPRIVGVIAAGRLVHLTEADRLTRSANVPRRAVAA